MKYSFAIAGYSLPDLETGATMNQGDIIAYMPEGHKWGKEEVKRFLIVEIDVESEEEASSFCRVKYKDTTWEEHEAYLENEEKEMQAIFEKYAIGGVVSDLVKTQYNSEVKEVRKKYPAIPIEKKRQYCVDLLELDTDIKKLEDTGLEYQPLKEISKTMIKEVAYGVS